MTSKSIRSISDAYLKLYSDMHYDVKSDEVVITKHDIEIHLKSESDYIRWFEYLCEFAIDKRQRSFIVVRYGLTNGIARTLTESGELLQCSAEHVRAQIKTAFRKLNHVNNMRRTCSRWLEEETM